MKIITKFEAPYNLLTLYGVGLSFLMWSGRTCSSCLMHRSLMSLRGGKGSLVLPSENSKQVTNKGKKTDSHRSYPLNI